MKRAYLLSGVASPLIYAFTVILGGVLWHDYSHASQAISELTAAGAPFFTWFYLTGRINSRSAFRSY